MATAKAGPVVSAMEQASKAWTRRGEEEEADPKEAVLYGIGKKSSGWTQEEGDVADYISSTLVFLHVLRLCVSVAFGLDIYSVCREGFDFCLTYPIPQDSANE